MNPLILLIILSLCHFQLSTFYWCPNYHCTPHLHTNTHAHKHTCTCTAHQGWSCWWERWRGGRRSKGQLRSTYSFLGWISHPHSTYKEMGYTLREVRRGEAEKLFHFLPEPLKLCSSASLWNAVRKSGPCDKGGSAVRGGKRSPNENHSAFAPPHFLTHSPSSSMLELKSQQLPNEWERKKAWENKGQANSSHTLPFQTPLTGAGVWHGSQDAVEDTCILYQSVWFEFQFFQSSFLLMGTMEGSSWYLKCLSPCPHVEDPN